LNLPKREEQILEFWDENDIFKKTLAKTSRGEPFVFYEGPPYANGLPGIHHFEGRVFKDIIVRHRTMQGFSVPRKAGWDTHGLPVEIQVEKELGLKSKKDIERYGIAAFNAKCRESVLRHKQEWERFTKRIGYWLDLEHAYLTLSTNYIETLWWIIRDAWKKKMFYQDFKVLPWCPRCETPLSSHELGFGYQTVKDRSVYVRFHLKAKSREWERTVILSWTTTPWTLPGNVALAVNEKETYVRIPDPDVKGQWLILGEKRFRDLVESHQFPPEYRSRLMLDDIDTFKGKELLGIEYEPLFSVQELISTTSHRIYAGDFVTMEEGTGIVHTAVMYGEDDYRLGKQVGLPAFHTVDETGHFIASLSHGLAGLYVKDPATDELIIKSLKERGFLFKEELFEHEYPFCWRCGTPVLYYARQSWWIKMSSLKKDLVANNETINWIPETIKRGRFGEFLGEVRDWAFSRERYWGTPIPVWECGGCRHQEVIGSLEEFAKRAGPSRNKYIAMRHGDAETLMMGIVSSASTFHLTNRGKDGTKKKAKQLRSLGLDMIIASPVGRAHETANIIGKALGLSVRTDSRLREIEFGILEGKSDAEYNAFFGSEQRRFEMRPEGGESLRDVRKRVVELLDTLEREYSGKTILLVSHADPIWILWGTSQGFSEQEMIDSHPRDDEFIAPDGLIEVPLRKLPRDDTGEVNLHRPFVDEITFPCAKCKSLMKRIPEVADVWFDSGAMPFAQNHYPFEHAKDLPYPADYISEGVDMTRGWFYTLLAVSTLLGKGASYKNVISLGLVLDKHGQKMSKSKGNAVEPWAVIEKYGTDAIRWFFFTVNAPGDSVRFNEEEVLLKLRGALSTLWNSLVLFDTYVDKIQDFKLEAQTSKNVLDQWIVAKLDELTHAITSQLNDYDVVGAARLLDSFIVEDFSNWYLRRSRRRFQKPESKIEQDEASRTTAFVLLRLSELMAPFTPFLAEIIYHELRKKLGLEEESVHLRSWPQKRTSIPPKARLALGDKKQETKLIEGMTQVRHFAALALAERAKAGIKVRQPLAKLIINSKQLAKSPELLNLLKDEINVKEVVADAHEKEEIRLDTALTRELREEGLARELIRNIQEMRRDGELRPKEQIRVEIQGDAMVDSLLSRWQVMLKHEVGARTITYVVHMRSKIVRDAVLGDLHMTIGITKT